MSLPISPILKVGDTIYIGGTPPLGENGVVVEGGVEPQTKTIIKRMEGLLSEAGLGLENLAFVTVYLSDINDYKAMNKVYSEVMPPPYPARKVVITTLTLKGMLVEMTGIASVCKKEVV